MGRETGASRPQFPPIFPSSDLPVKVVTMLFNRKRRALHDFIGGTVVVVGRGQTRGNQ